MLYNYNKLSDSNIISNEIYKLYLQNRLMEEKH